MKECPAEEDSVPVGPSKLRPLLRDKLPSLYWERLRWYVERVVQEKELLGEFWVILESNGISKEIRTIFGKSWLTVPVRSLLWVEVEVVSDGNDGRGGTSFDWSSLYRDSD
ncbi:hypothetical protein GN244_ATG08434 [Phytophthora infestans]|uniref:Uncharacterized protein n=1 Tax=Phytophthora infestans TaxID=4787 RepID=A0A833SVG4_PHYIN|nr:hypothetical protein GN244_ATG08434 [Phytophthora infestans]